MSASARVALVTGASFGQGAEHARRLTSDGLRVVATDLSGTVPSGFTGDFHVLDVADERNWTQVVGEVLAEYGHIDVLVNNAGITGPSLPVEETSHETYRQVVEVNQFGCFLGMRAVIPAMRAAGTGSIINISSVAGMGGIPGRIPYQASKWAIRGMTRTAAVELAGTGVRVNTIVPGWVDTQMAANAELPLEEIAAGIPLKRIAAPAEISALVSFLASAESRYMTGSDLVVDGGLRARI
ncbi:MAG: 3-alpha-hydroxysteroid dehydrogenase [Amycolatopsis sp.]|uniref:SDR family NAD(P)-dependent oxidoreductase n=1 Tax=Amycolatopsis sp. TaxID=37632 RepID=UPI002634F5BD|nr:SDR family oxidoreductase [Amycolatopsis sp.]MCU1679940.1 3-alpha-hydroxysteroid dehydrogenase [Amycolatopsis sp.]